MSTNTPTRAHIVKETTLLVGVAAAAVAVPFGLLGLVLGGPIVGLALAAGAGGYLGMVMSGIALVIGVSDNAMRKHAATRTATAALCAAACLGLNQGGRLTLEAVDTVHGALTAAATQAFEPVTQIETAARQGVLPGQPAARTAVL